MLQGIKWLESLNPRLAIQFINLLNMEYYTMHTTAQKEKIRDTRIHAIQCPDTI
jgi:hypothetical protein